MANGITQYLGARYVPVFFDDNGSTDWRSGVAYEPLTIVTYLSNSYTSKIPVPATVGNPADNPTYWASTGIYNAQVEAYRQQVQEYMSDVSDLSDTLDELREKLAIRGYLNVISIGDSWGLGHVDGDVYTTGWGSVVKSLIPHKTYIEHYENGLGFINHGSSGYTAESWLNSQRSSDDIDIILMVLGLNDHTNTTGAITSAVQSFAELARTKFPNAIILNICCQRTRAFKIDYFAQYNLLWNLTGYIPNYIGIEAISIINHRYYFNDIHLQGDGYKRLGWSIAGFIMFNRPLVGNDGITTYHYDIDGNDFALNTLKVNGMTVIYSTAAQDFNNISYSTVAADSPFTFTPDNDNVALLTTEFAMLDIPIRVSVSGETGKYFGTWRFDGSGNLRSRGYLYKDTDGSLIGAGSTLTRITILPFCTVIPSEIF